MTDKKIRTVNIGIHHAGLASLSPLRSVHSNLQAQNSLAKAVTADNEVDTSSRTCKHSSLWLNT
jgi:hypothetical protein